MIFDKGLMKEMFGFAGWNFIGSSSALLRDQGGNILTNLFFGPSVNAARGIAMQVGTAATSFVNSFTTAVNPQITKCYANGEMNSAMKLVFQSAKFSFIILLFITLPIFISASYVLELWLKEVPDYTVVFVQLTLIFTLMECLAIPLRTLSHATGKIRDFQLVVGGIQMLNFPISYICLKFGLQPEYVFVIAIAISVLCEMGRLVMLKKMVGLPVGSFLKDIYFVSIIVAIISAIIPWFIRNFFSQNFVSFIILSLITVICVATVSYTIGCTKADRATIRMSIKKVSNKFLKKSIKL